ncbi:hypothetical protein [Ferroplasma sp.]|uniref:hypothetical protein n=1 Tax=Ferroplasma sp. TaxID=2591003 RepID=UPI00307D251B
MIIAQISFCGGRLGESDNRAEMDMEDVKKTLAYAFLYDFTVNVYTDNGEYKFLSISAIKYNDRGNLFFSGNYYYNNSRVKKSFSWREIVYIDINVEKEPEKSIY